MLKSFVDLLFILLCGTIVSLSQSFQLGALETAPAKIGSGGISEVCADQAWTLVVNPSDYTLIDNQGVAYKLQTLEGLLLSIRQMQRVVVVARTEGISHQRVMDCWDQCRVLGIKAQLGVERKTANTGGQ